MTICILWVELLNSLHRVSVSGMVLISQSKTELLGLRDTVQSTGSWIDADVQPE